MYRKLKKRALFTFYLRESIRESWANPVDFSHKQFYAMHAGLENKFSDIDIYAWDDYEINRENGRDKIANEIEYLHRTVFILGTTHQAKLQQKIYEESRTYQDILQENFHDSYNNLTIKSLMMLKWVNNNCANKGKCLCI